MSDNDDLGIDRQQQFGKDVQHIDGQADEASSTPMASSQHSENLEKIEARARVAKLNLEMEKIALEKRSIARQLSWQGTALEWAKAASVFAALVGIATTLYLGQKQTDLAQTASQNQSRQAEEARAADRFDKALGRLSDSNPGVRMTGIAGLRLFLNDGNEQHQKDALHYLVTAIAEEKSREVQQAILDAFVDAKRFSQVAKDDALRTAVELDRSVTESVVREKQAAIEKTRRALIAKFLSKKEGDLPSTIYESDLKNLTFLQLMQVKQITAKSLFYDPNISGATAPEDTITLEKFVTVINLLIAAGAKNITNNWTKIYCQNCDFSGAGDLSGARFDEAHLSGANFAHVKLQNATFRDAALGNTVFFSSDLSNADLSWNALSSSVAASSAASIRVFTTFPYLECATLNGANLSGLPLAALSRQFFGPRQDGAASNTYDNLTMPRMAKVKFDAQTKLEGLGIRLDFTFDGEYYATLTTDQRAQFEAAFSSFTFDWPAPLGDFKYGSVKAVDEVSFGSDDQHVAMEFVRADRITQLYHARGVSDWAKPLFAKVLDQPIWKSIPVTNEIGAASLDASVQAKTGDAPKYDCAQISVPDDLEIIASR